MRRTILVIDDDRAVREALRRFLAANGFEVVEARTLMEGHQAFRACRPDVTVLDYSLPDGASLELVPKLKAIDPGAPIVILTGHGSIDLAVQAIKEGAENFLTKPVAMPVLLSILERAIESRRAKQKALAADATQRRESLDPFVGTSAAIRKLAKTAEKVAGAEAPTLILGETGAGKGVLARWVHENSPRAREPFVDLNCAGLARDFLETELFGHVKGAFTGAAHAKQGLLEIAHRGSVFLDEIGDVELQVQPKLLKVLEEKRFRPLGEVHDHGVDIRLIAATHYDLARLVAEKRFREDLYFRISTIALVIPPLRDRREDIPPLVEQFLAAKRFRLSPSAMEALVAYNWPGNIRELRNVLERAVLLASDEVLERDDLSFDVIPREVPLAREPAGSIDEVEKAHIERVLEETSGNVSRAAKRLGISRSALHVRIKKYSIAVVRD